ncbi:MAG: hypothetical protein B1H11_02295 [Desulfobacteraceae bacterium 4484_190.1]|nr:MAG: hypothetical protein B1H11_02295 [Desulfobacteraceae bacterium 4484_190.1]
MNEIMQNKIEIIEKMRSELLSGTDSEAIETRHKARALTARERVEKLLDPGTFYEIELFSKPIETGLPVDKKTIRGDGLVVGYGDVNGQPICVWAQDATMFGGKVGITHGAKIVTLIERALKANFVFMVRNSSYMCVSSPPEGVASEDMGGAPMHFKKTGCCDVLADSDEECIQKAKELLGFLPSNNNDTAPLVDNGDDVNREVPELLDIVPGDSKKPYRVQDVIIAIVDNGQFFETKGGWATNLVVGFARFGGKSVGIIANNPWIMGGCLDVDSADKLARFVRFCDAFNIPLVYLADTPAFLPGIEQERRGIIRHGAKTVFANSVATTSQIQVYLRKCYGGGNLGMPGNNLGGDFGILWPTAEVLLMHPEGAVSIIYRKEIAEADDPKKEYQQRVAQFKETGAVENVWEVMTGQDYIHPKDTRSKIIRTLRLLEGKRLETRWHKHDNMPL